MEHKKIAVIGAGIAGLTCAYELQKAGHTVVVYEKEHYVGGRMSTREKDGFPMDIGANHLANVYTHMRKYADELGLTWGPMHFLNYRVIKNGKLTRLLEGISNWSRFKLGIQSFFGVRKKTDFFDLNTAAKYDTDNAGHFIEKKVGKEALDYLIDPFVSTYQFHGADEMSLGVVYAMMRSHYQNKGDWALQNIKGGMIALPQALADTLDMHLGEGVVEVNPTEKGVLIKTKKEEKHFDLAVLATTTNISEKIYPKATEAQKKLFSTTEYATTIGVGFKVPKDLLGNLTIAWVPHAESGTISGYTHEAMKGPDLIQGDTTLLLTWFHESFAKTIIDKSDKEIFEIARKELTKHCPLITDASVLKPHDLQRWPEAMPKYKHGHLKLVKEFLDSHQGEHNVYLCGDYLNAPWTEGALRNGQAVAETILAAK